MSVSGRIRVSVIIGGLRVPLRVSLVLNRHHAAGQGTAATPVASKPEGVTAGNVVVVGVLEEETLRAYGFRLGVVSYFKGQPVQAMSGIRVGSHARLLHGVPAVSQAALSGVLGRRNPT